jgi:hypothetical protein
LAPLKIKTKNRKSRGLDYSHKTEDKLFPEIELFPPSSV